VIRFKRLAAVAGLPVIKLPGAHLVVEPPHDRPRVFVVPQAVQHADEHDPYRLAEVECVAYLPAMAISPPV
jgi:hypothetical protein